MHADTDSRLLFQKQLKSVQDKWLKVHFVLMTTKDVLALLGKTPEAISLYFFCECTLWPLTYIPSFIQMSSGLAEM